MAIKEALIELFITFVIMFLCFFMVIHCFDKIPTTTPLPDFHRLSVHDDFFEAFHASFQSPRPVCRKEKVDIAALEIVANKKKLRRSYPKPSEPSSGTPVEIDDISFKGVQ